jgi:hypothetical protein
MQGKISEWFDDKIFEFRRHKKAQKKHSIFLKACHRARASNDMIHKSIFRLFCSSFSYLSCEWIFIHLKTDAFCGSWIINVERKKNARSRFQKLGIWSHVTLVVSLHLYLHAYLCIVILKRLIHYVVVWSRNSKFSYCFPEKFLHDAWQPRKLEKALTWSSLHSERHHMPHTREIIGSDINQTNTLSDDDNWLSEIEKEWKKNDEKNQ